MATQAIIAIVNEDKTVTACLVTTDGYVSFTGPRLLNNFQTNEAVAELVKYDRFQIEDSPIIDQKNKTEILFDEFRTYNTVQEFIHNMNGYGHKYIFNNGSWWYGDTLIPLTDMVKKYLPPRYPITVKISDSKNCIKYAWNHILYAVKTVISDLVHIWRS